MTLSLTGPRASGARRWWRSGAARVAEDVSPEFHQAFVRGIMETERLRMKMLVVASVVILVAVSTVALFFPQFVEQVWKKQVSLRYLFAIFIPFIVFECIAVAVISR